MLQFMTSLISVCARLLKIDDVFVRHPLFRVRWASGRILRRWDFNFLRWGKLSYAYCVERSPVNTYTHMCHAWGCACMQCERSRGSPACAESTCTCAATCTCVATHIFTNMKPLFRRIHVNIANQPLLRQISKFKFAKVFEIKCVGTIT